MDKEQELAPLEEIQKIIDRLPCPDRTSLNYMFFMKDIERIRDILSQNHLISKETPLRKHFATQFMEDLGINQTNKLREELITLKARLEPLIDFMFEGLSGSIEGPDIEDEMLKAGLIRDMTPEEKRKCNEHENCNGCEADDACWVRVSL